MNKYDTGMLYLQKIHIVRHSAIIVGTVTKRVRKLDVILR